jgi:hypothetical protein
VTVIVTGIATATGGGIEARAAIAIGGEGTRAGVVTGRMTGGTAGEVGGPRSGGRGRPGGGLAAAAAAS